MFKRILKTVLSLGAGHGIQTLTQLLIPPAFIASYGVAGFGQWLVLGASVGYLTTLDFGLQTYVLNELTVLFHRRDMAQFHRIQSVGLRLMFMFLAVGGAFAASVFFLPITSLLKLKQFGTAAEWAFFWLALQLLGNIALGQIVGTYRVIGQAHRGVMWGNLQRTLLLAVTVALAYLKAPFWALALAQFSTVCFVLPLVLWSLSRTAPEVFPQLNYWNRQIAIGILKPSAFFGLFVLNQFLVFQAPVLLLNAFLGAAAVVAFTVARTLFGFVRQGTSLIQAAIAPEVTRLNGIGDQEKLVRVYLLSESIVLTVALTINVGLILLAPAILSFWLKRTDLFDLATFLPIMIVSIVMSVKDYKLYFQYATNNHIQTAVLTFASYLVMIIVSFPAIRWFGLTGFMAVWILTELLQTGFLHFYNAQFLRGRITISIRPAIRLGVALSAVVLLLCAGHPFLESKQLISQAMVAISAMLLLASISYFLFDLSELMQEGKAQVVGLRFG